MIQTLDYRPQLCKDANVDCTYVFCQIHIKELQHLYLFVKVILSADDVSDSIDEDPDLLDTF